MMITTHANATAKQILIYGHRGARGLAPENTIPAYQKALAIGVNYVDMDVGMTKDNVVVVTHDFALNPNLTKGSSGDWLESDNLLLKDLTWQQLQNYDVGTLKPGTLYSKNFPDQVAVPNTHIPNLKEVIRYIKKIAGDKINFQVEIKIDPLHPDWTYSPEKMARAVVAILKAEKVEKRTEIQAFDWQVLQWIQKIAPEIATAYLTNPEICKNMLSTDPAIAGLWSAGFLVKDYENSIPKMIASLGGKIWGPKYIELTKDNVAEAHRYGLKVVPWTVNAKKDIEKMVDFQVDGIISDRPDVAREVLAKHGYPLPQAF